MYFNFFFFLTYIITRKEVLVRFPPSPPIYCTHKAAQPGCGSLYPDSGFAVGFSSSVQGWVLPVQVGSEFCYAPKRRQELPMVSSRADEEHWLHVISTATPRSLQHEHLFVKSHHKRAAKRVRAQTSANTCGHVRTAALPTRAEETCSSACILRTVDEVVKLRHSSSTLRGAVSQATLHVQQLLTWAYVSRTTAVETDPDLLGMVSVHGIYFLS